MIGLDGWHARFEQQAAWTASVRRYLLELVDARQALRILEAGCGTGALTLDLHAHSPAQVYGIDIDLARLLYAQHSDPASRFACADGLRLPFTAASFDLSVCHYYLLWVADPLAALAEIARVTRPGGWVLALAEPDYGGRLEYPAELAELGILQTQSLLDQGADPEIGRRLPSIFLQAGLKEVRSGVLGGEWQHPAAHADSTEWDVLENDLRDILTPAQLLRYREIEIRARQTGQRLQFIPTFYAFGRV